MKKILLILFIGLMHLNSNAQNEPLIDSMLHLLKNAKPDSNKVLLLLNIGEQYERFAPETSKRYYWECLQLSKKIGYQKGEIKFASYYTAVLNMQGRFDSSLLLNLEALKLARQMKDELIIAKATFNTANSYHMLSKADSSLFYYMQVLPILDRLGDKRMLGIAYGNIQNIYSDLGQYQKAIEYGKKGLEIYEKELNEPLSHSYCLSNLGIVYSELKKFDTAELYFTKALKLSQGINDQYAMSAILLNLADIDYNYGRLEESKKKFSQSYLIAKEMNLLESQTIALKGLAMYNLEKKNYSMARTYADSSLDIAIQLNSRKQTVKLYNLLADISYASQDLKSAHLYEEKEDSLNDIINADNLQKLSTEYETKYETEKKETRIQLQQSEIKQKSILNYLLIAGSIALLLISLLTYRNYTHRQKLQQSKIDELEKEKLLTATEAVLKGEEQERSRLAKDLHDGLGGMLSGIKHSLSSMKENLIMTADNALAFERSIDMLDSSIKEMRRVAHNMMPEMLVKYGLGTALGEFCKDITGSGVAKVSYQPIGMENASVDQTIAVSIYRIAQELVNNSIKHGNAKEILVQLHLSEQENLLALTVEDDGKGMDLNKVNESKGIGWKNIQSRVDFLQGKLDVQSLPGNGTSVMVEINI